MNPIEPKRESFTLPLGTDALIFAKDQPNYIPLPALRTRAGEVITQWQPSPEELAKIAAGEPITLVMHTFQSRCQHCGGPIGLTPVQLTVGGINMMENV